MSLQGKPNALVDSDRITINRQFSCVKLAARIHVVALLEGMESGLKGSRHDIKTTGTTNMSAYTSIFVVHRQNETYPNRPKSPV